MNKRQYILIFAIITQFIACEEKSDLDLSTDATDLIVVEGIITNENISHRIKLSRTYSLQNETAAPVTADTVFITDGVNGYGLIEPPIGSGEYYTPSFRAVFGRVYFLFFAYQGKEYIAADRSPAGQPLDTLAYEQADNNEGESYRLILDDDGTQSNFIEYDVNWESTLDCTTSVDCFGKLIYYDLKTIDVHEIYKPNKEDFLFPIGSQVIRKKYSVSKPYETFLRSLLSETEWRGGLFDIERANVTTNLSEGAIGFFAVSTVVTDTTIIE